MKNSTWVRGKVIDLVRQRIAGAAVLVGDGKIERINYEADEPAAENEGPYLLPGFVDAHVHIESSMLTPVQFARLAVVHGTVATVSDPHEIGNVLGTEGVEYMLENARPVPFKFCFGAPSCVPATTFETAGAAITVADLAQLFHLHPQVGYLAEMMNFPGVLNGDATVLAKIALAKQLGKPVDGHAPGLRGEAARRYVEAGISTDHECFGREEALDKLGFGMKILIREGSAAKNFEALADLLHQHADRMMFCSDDKHPDSLVEGHINQLVKRALARGIDLFKVLRAACLNPVRHYGLPVGLLQPGDPADFIVVDNLRDWNVRQTYVDGQLVAENGTSLIPNLPSRVVNRFDTLPKTPEQFGLPAPKGSGTHCAVRVIEVLDGQLVTRQVRANLSVVGGLVRPDPARDILKIAVVNRYQNEPPAVAFIRNFGLREGALASSVGHDSHNLVAVGVSDELIARAVNRLIEARGGIAAVSDREEALLPLPIAGLMSGEDGYRVADQYARLDALAKRMGSPLQAPFMSLSFMALLVIPSLKLSDLGLFDGERFAFTEVVINPPHP
ncbi:MAG: adenine deaminase [Ferruginibacter sp.]|nr:adenine deaminase [Cytophagales bacterium]